MQIRSFQTKQAKSIFVNANTPTTGYSHSGEKREERSKATLMETSSQATGFINRKANFHAYQNVIK